MNLLIKNLNILSKKNNLNNITKIFKTCNIDFKKYYINNPIKYEKSFI